MRRTTWTTADEGIHVEAARFLKTGDGLYKNPEHPVGTKLLASAFLESRPAVRPVDDTRAARRPFPWLYAALVLLSGLWALRLGGPVCGVSVAGLLLADPSLRGHGALVHTDVPLALLLVATGFALEVATAWRRPRPALLLAAGLVYGLALAGKYSALPFLAVVGGLALWRMRGLGRRAFALAGGLVAVPALLVAFALTEAAFSGVPRATLRESAVTKWRVLNKTGDPGPLFDHGPKGLATYRAGLLYVREESGPGKRLNYLFGRVSGRGFLSYFPVALLVKLPAAAVAGLLAAGALAVGFALRARTSAAARAPLARAAVPGLLGLSYLLAAMATRMNIGVRHALPAVPLLVVAAAVLVVRANRGRPRLVRFALAGAAALSLLEAGLRLDREISFGNVLAGGPSGLRRILSDSNVEWGQEQGRLYGALRRLGSRAGYLAPFIDASELATLPANRPVFDPNDPQVDVVVVSTFLWDLGRALAKNDETWPKVRYYKTWMAPLVEGLGRRAVRIEPLGDGYLVLTLGPPRAATP